MYCFIAYSWSTSIIAGDRLQNQVFLTEGNPHLILNHQSKEIVHPSCENSKKAPESLGQSHIAVTDFRLQSGAENPLQAHYSSVKLILWLCCVVFYWFSENTSKQGWSGIRTLTLDLNKKRKKMARDYFIQTTSLVPPRGVSVEMTEIRPLRPNQAIILPGVAVLGHGLKFEVSKTISFVL